MARKIAPAKAIHGQERNPSEPIAAPSKATRASLHPLSARPAPFGKPEIAILIFAVALRAALFVLGRIPLDGDEAILGVMSYDLAAMNRVPLYFYRQHYMGSLEIPPVAMLMALGPQGWKFSIWPIRIVEMIYFLALLGVHFKLTSRLFGAAAARWIMFFLCIGPVYWMDYSVRLRHVVLMMLIGETAALLAIGLIYDWECRRSVRGSKAFALGLLAGAGWWHYQLILAMLVPIAALFARFPTIVADAFRRPVRADPSSDEPPLTYQVDEWGIARAVLMALALSALAGLSVGWFDNPRYGYPLLIGLLASFFLIAAAIAYASYRNERDLGDSDARSARSRHEALLRFAPALALLGFLTGYAPALIYLVRLKEEFWVSRVHLDLLDLWPRFKAFFILDITSMLEITRPLKPEGMQHTTTPRTFANLGLYGMAVYIFLRQAVAPGQPGRRVGVLLYSSLLAALILLHILTPPRDHVVLAALPGAPVPRHLGHARASGGSAYRDFNPWSRPGPSSGHGGRLVRRRGGIVVALGADLARGRTGRDPLALGPPQDRDGSGPGARSARYRTHRRASRRPQCSP